jgi:hypothetical protein
MCRNRLKTARFMQHLLRIQPYARVKEVNSLKTLSGVEVYRQADCARRLKISRARVSQLIREGGLAYVDQEGFRLITAESMKAYQASQLGRLLKSGAVR